MQKQTGESAWEIPEGGVEMTENEASDAGAATEEETHNYDYESGNEYAGKS